MSLRVRDMGMFFSYSAVVFLAKILETGSDEIHLFTFLHAVSLRCY